jgi:catalase
VNALKFTNGHGTSRFARYHIRPFAEEQHLSDAETAGKSPNFLFDEIAERLGKGPAKMKLAAQLTVAGDQPADASIPWPDDRPQLELGVITLTKKAEESDAIQRRSVYDPANLIDGIELSDDPLPAARSAIYSIAYQRRNAKS